MYSEAAATDRFGYLLPNLAKEESAARNLTASYEDLRARNWPFSEVGAYSQKRLKQLVRDGVPCQIRPSVWLQLSGANGLRQKIPSSYFATLITRPPHKALVIDVESAVLRHLPSHQLLHQAHGLHSVVQVVQAFQKHLDRSLCDNHYCIAAFLVTVLGLGREEDCFWIMVGLLTQTLPQTFTQQEFAQEARIEQQVLEELLKRRCSKLLAAFAANDYPLHQVTATWFSHLFCGILPAETTVRVWDSILLEGPKVAFRVAIALLKREESVVAGNLQKIRTIQWRTSRTYNADALLKVAFKGIGSLSSAEMVAARCRIEALAPFSRQPTAKRLEALLCPPRLSPQHSASSGASELSTAMEVPPEPHAEQLSKDDDLAAIKLRLPSLKT